MSNLQKILAEEYRKQHSKITIAGLTEMVNQALDGVYNTLLTETSSAAKVTTAKEFMLSLPKFTPTESWGDPGSMERKQINQIFSVIGGGYNTEKKLEYLQRIVDPQNEITSPRRIIASLIILESLSAVITSFSSSSAGFVFEGFISALLHGEQVADVSDKGNLPIEDLIAFSGTDKGTPISLKLLNLKTYIEGSLTNLIDALDEYGEMTYIVARKDKGGGTISIEQFVLNRDNFINALTTSAAGGTTAGKKSFQIIDFPGIEADFTPEESIAKLNSIENWEDKYELLQYIDGYSTKVRTKRKETIAQAAQEERDGEEMVRLKKIGGNDLDPVTALQEAICQEWKETLKESKGGAGGHQWGISGPRLSSYDFVDYRNYGALPYSAEQLEKIAEMHMGKLNEELFELFSATQQLSENINQYFTYEDRTDAISSGEVAIENTVVIQDSLKADINKSEDI